MLCLGVETSCDETGLALVRGRRVLARQLASQADVHALFGGVVPEIASREHYRVLPRLFDRLMRTAEAGPYTVQDLDVIAVARGPGLLGALLVGLGFAKGLALGAPRARLVGVDHLHAHLLTAELEQDFAYPAIGVLVSGGHTHLVLMRSPLDFTVLGRTLDDAAGEAFDKAAKSLNLPYPGGRLMDALAQLAEPDQDMFPRPYLDNQNLDFSFSGLKTAAALAVREQPELRFDSMDVSSDPESAVLEQGRRCPELARFCASFTYSVADTLRVKTERALTYLEKGFAGVEKLDEPVRTLTASGGVAANSAVRSMLARLAAQHAMELRLPPLDLCADNGVMIAWAGAAIAESGWAHSLELEAIPRGRRIPWDYTHFPG